MVTLLLSMFPLAPPKNPKLSYPVNKVSVERGFRVVRFGGQPGLPTPSPTADMLYVIVHQGEREFLTAIRPSGSTRTLSSFDEHDPTKWLDGTDSKGKPILRQLPPFYEGEPAPGSLRALRGEHEDPRRWPKLWLERDGARLEAVKRRKLAVRKFGRLGNPIDLAGDPNAGIEMSPSGSTIICSLTDDLRHRQFRVIHRSGTQLSSTTLCQKADKALQDRFIGIPGSMIVVDDRHVLVSIAKDWDKFGNGSKQHPTYVISDSAPLQFETGAKIEVDSIDVDTGRTHCIAMLTATKHGQEGRMALVGRNHFGLFLSAGRLAILPTKIRYVGHLR